MRDEDTEGTWEWESDGADVTWFKWATGTGSSGQAEPDGDTGENCAKMLRRKAEKHGRTTDSWSDVSCVGSDPGEAKSVVCQKRKSGFPLSYKQTNHDSNHLSNP